MKPLVITAAALCLMTAAPLFAQDSGGPEAAGYVTGVGGFSTSLGGTTADMLIEGGVSVAPHLMVIGNIGRFQNLQSDLQPTLDAATAALAANQGLSVTGGGSTLPAAFYQGGLRLEVPTG